MPGDSVQSPAERTEDARPGGAAFFLLESSVGCLWLLRLSGAPTSGSSVSDASARQRVAKRRRRGAAGRSQPGLPGGKQEEESFSTEALSDLPRRLGAPNFHRRPDPRSSALSALQAGDRRRGQLASLELRSASRLALEVAGGSFPRKSKEKPPRRRRRPCPGQVSVPRRLGSERRGVSATPPAPFLC